MKKVKQFDGVKHQSYVVEFEKNKGEWAVDDSFDTFLEALEYSAREASSVAYTRHRICVTETKIVAILEPLGKDV